MVMMIMSIMLDVQYGTSSIQCSTYKYSAQNNYDWWTDFTMKVLGISN